MRLLRAYCEEMLEFAGWAKTFSNSEDCAIDSPLLLFAYPRNVAVLLFCQCDSLVSVIDSLRA